MSTRSAPCPPSKDSLALLAARIATRRAWTSGGDARAKAGERAGGGERANPGSQ